MVLANLHDLMLHEMKDIYNAERQLVQTLPRIARRTRSQELQQAILNHLAQTENHVARLEQAFGLLDQPVKSHKCEGMRGLLEEGKSLMEEEVDPDVLDAGIIMAAQKVEHYEIATYGTLCAYAKAMGHAEVARLLEETLAEEKEADQLLSSLAEGGINELAEVGNVAMEEMARGGGGDGVVRNGRAGAAGRERAVARDGRGRVAASGGKKSGRRKAKPSSGRRSGTR